MEESCEDCMRWEEELYWTHFQTLHFSQLLLPGFHNRLTIPQKFSTYCKKKLPKIVTLKSPSGVTYDVELEEDDEKTLAFGCGWDKFVKDHSLEENDLLIFKFQGVSDFEVLIFDGDTLCEKPTSYFVRRCGHAEKTKGTAYTATTSRSAKRRIHNSTDDDNDDVGDAINNQPVISPVGNELEDLVDIDIGIDTMFNPHLVVSQNGFGKEEHNDSDIDTESGQHPVMSPTSTKRIGEGKYPLSVLKKMRGETSINDLVNKSGGSKKSINETYQRKAISQAKNAISPNGFLVVMKRSHVQTKCFLNVPMRWCEKNTILNPREVVMQVDQTKWHLRLNFFGSTGRGGISTGWKKFVRDNNLCQGDVCVFEPAKSETNKPLHLDVNIFRASESESSNSG